MLLCQINNMKTFKITGFILCLISPLTMYSQEIQILETYDLKGLSIRAIEPDSKEGVYFVSDQGFQGYVDKTGEVNTTKIDSLAYRSIASYQGNVYALSIGSPALLRDLATKEIQYKENHVKVFYDAMTISDSGLGFAIGDPTEDFMSVIRTEDGGTTWEKLDGNRIPKTVTGEAAFAASNSNVKIIGKTYYFISGGKESRFYSSKDQGDTWKVQTLPLISGKETTGAYSMDFYDQNIGVVAGGDYTDKDAKVKTVALTTDGGDTWKTINPMDSPGYSSCVQFMPYSNGNTIVALSNIGLSISKDYGKSWETFPEIKGYYTIRFIDEKRAWLAGQEKISLVSF